MPPKVACGTEFISLAIIIEPLNATVSPVIDEIQCSANLYFPGNRF